MLNINHLTFFGIGICIGLIIELIIYEIEKRYYYGKTK